MRLNTWIKVQLTIFAVVAVVAGTIMVFGFIRVPEMLGVGRYSVTMELPRTAGLYERGNVTYRGTEVGKVASVELTDTGVEAVLSLRSDVSIPADLDARVHSASAIGEQYVALVPRSGDGPPLRGGDRIPRDRTAVPPEIGALLDAANRGLQAIPDENIKTVIDESYVAVGGLGPEISRIVRGSTRLAIDAHTNLEPMVALIDEVKPLLDSQADSAEDIRRWAAHVADITGQVRSKDAALAGLLTHGGQAAAEAQALMDRLQPTLPILLANLVSVGQLTLTYQPAVEQLLVLLPQAVQIIQAGTIANRDTKNPGMVLSFNLNLNLPPPCTTGYLPAQQQRVPTLTDTPDRPAADLYCRIPQDSWMAVRGARNLPCMTRPGKRAPTAKMCKSDEVYVPLNEGFNWKGDPNATVTGQDIPQAEPLSATAQAHPPISGVPYDPATGAYVGPDGREYVHSDLAPGPVDKTWQSMLTPPGGGG